MDFPGKGLDDGKDQDRSGRDKFGKTEREEKNQPILFKLVVDQYTELPEPCTACPIFLLTFISVFISV